VAAATTRPLPSPRPKTANVRAATVDVANSGPTEILVDSEGRTLYLFKKDAGTKSTCFDACANAWPPLRANGKPTVGAGAKASLLGTTARADEKPQVTYKGQPLYLYGGDARPKTRTARRDDVRGAVVGAKPGGKRSHRPGIELRWRRIDRRRLLTAARRSRPSESTSSRTPSLPPAHTTYRGEDSDELEHALA